MSSSNISINSILGTNLPIKSKNHKLSIDDLLDMKNPNKRSADEKIKEIISLQKERKKKEKEFKENVLKLCLEKIKSGLELGSTKIIFSPLNYVNSNISERERMISSKSLTEYIYSRLNKQFNVKIVSGHLFFDLS